MFGRRIVGIMLAACLAAAMASPAGAAGAEVTTGELVALPGATALGITLEGSATMRRVPGENGKTLVTVHVRGLAANTTYPTHVHNAPCSGSPAGGGHYQHQVGGPADRVNEIWPVVVTNADGVGLGKASHAFWARPDARAIVMHHPADTSIRLACADLG